LWNVYARLFRPLNGYRKYICDDLMPVHDDADLFVVGANSTRAFTFDPFGFWKNGSLSQQQLEEIRRRFALAKPGALKILVMHHPLINPWNGGSRDTARGRRRIIRSLQQTGVDIVLSGHLHKAYAAHAMALSRNGHRVMCIQAGTACSTRLRDEPNAFNLLHWHEGKLSLTIMRYNGTTFAPEEALPLI
jgi:3',5'-cyclic AMP phosphodiesterase CpdA